MQDRSAHNALKGYFYQFDYSILKVLDQKSNDSLIYIEGIEDIDVMNQITESIQCKYYEKTSYNHSVIAPAIRAFLEDFADRKKSDTELIYYSLYGHYHDGQEKLPQDVTINFLMDKIFTFKKKGTLNKLHDDLNLSFDDLIEFKSMLKININALNYDDQFTNLIVKIMEIFQCSTFEAEFFYYNNALKVIKDLAISEELEERKISKKDFLMRIDTKELIYNEWYYQLKSKSVIFREIRKQHFTQFNQEAYSRFFLIEIDDEKYKRQDVKDIIYLIVRKWSKTSNRSNPKYCPYIYLHNLRSSELIEIKKELTSENTGFEDGYYFNGSQFDADRMVKELHDDTVKFRFINSYEDIRKVAHKCRNRKEMYQFYLNEKFYDVPSDTKEVVVQVKKINNIEEII